MTVWLVHVPQNKLIFNLFDNHTEKIEVLVTAEDQKESMFGLFSCYYILLTQSHATSRSIQMRVESTCGYGTKQKREAAGGKCWCFLFLFFSFCHSLWWLCCHVRCSQQKGLALNSGFESEYLLTQLQQKRTCGTQTWNQVTDSHDALQTSYLFWYWQILQKHVWVNGLQIRNWHQFPQLLTTFFKTI